MEEEWYVFSWLIIGLCSFNRIRLLFIGKKKNHNSLHYKSPSFFKSKFTQFKAYKPAVSNSAKNLFQRYEQRLSKWSRSSVQVKRKKFTQELLFNFRQGFWKLASEKVLIGTERQARMPLLYKLKQLLWTWTAVFDCESHEIRLWRGITIGCHLSKIVFSVTRSFTTIDVKNGYWQLSS